MMFACFHNKGPDLVFSTKLKRSCCLYLAKQYVINLRSEGLLKASGDLYLSEAESCLQNPLNLHILYTK